MWTLAVGPHPLTQTRIDNTEKSTSNKAHDHALTQHVGPNSIPRRFSSIPGRRDAKL
jgi:hypothetical protein